MDRRFATELDVVDGKLAAPSEMSWVVAFTKLDATLVDA